MVTIPEFTSAMSVEIPELLLDTLENRETRSMLLRSLCPGLVSSLLGVRELVASSCVRRSAMEYSLDIFNRWDKERRKEFDLP